MREGKKRDVGKRHEDPHHREKRDRRGKRGNQDKKSAALRSSLCGSLACGGGAQGCFYSTQDAIDALRIPPEWTPRPEPVGDAVDHDLWEQQYTHWRNATCGCRRGYFCRRHGQWIPGSRLRNLDVDLRRQDQAGHSQCEELGLHHDRDLSPPARTEQRGRSEVTYQSGEAGPSQRDRTSWTASDNYHFSANTSAIPNNVDGYFDQLNFDYTGSSDVRQDYIETDFLHAAQTPNSLSVVQPDSSPVWYEDEVRSPYDLSPQILSAEPSAVIFDEVEGLSNLDLNNDSYDQSANDDYDRYPY